MNQDLWRVQLGTGEIRMMTLDALDRAFDEGVIDASVAVLAPGASAWTTLAEAAGLEMPGPTAETPSLSPMAIAPPSSAAMPAALSPQWDQDLSSQPDLDFDELAMAPRRGRALVIGGIVAAVVAAAGFTLAVGKLAPGATAADVKAAAVAAQAPPAADPLPPPEAKESKPELSDWQKKLLVDSDKAREEKARAKNLEKAEKAQRAQPRKAPKASTGLINGGDRFDPLNGAL